MIPKTIEVILQSPVSDNFRCKMACDSLDIDIKKKSIHHLKVENINIPDKWNVGLIYGASGSGKTTLAKKLFGEDVFKTVLDENEPIINQFPKEYNYEQCAELLSGIGLNSVPCWVRPVKTLSNGQRARAEAALLMIQNNGIINIDEWTSVVDRTVAKGMSHCLQKFARKNKKQIILLSCHYDVLEWLLPDWLIDCNEQKFHLKQNENFFFTERDKLKFDIKEIGRDSWKYFSKYHYLSEKLPGGATFQYGLFNQEKQVGFIAYSNYVPDVKGKKRIYHFNRIVIHPDFQGLKLGVKFINESVKLMTIKHRCRIMGKFSSVPTYKSLIKNECWKYLKVKRLFGKMKSSLISRKGRTGGFREAGIKTFHFEYVGNRTPA